MPVEMGLMTIPVIASWVISWGDVPDFATTIFGLGNGWFAPFPADRIDSAIGISCLSFGTSDASEGSLKTRPASSCSSS